MIISHIGGGIGNQLFMYAAGRRLAHKHNTELKLDLTFYQQYIGRPYALQLFNIRTKTASSEEIYRLKNFRHGREIENYKFMPEVLDYPDDVYLNGCWENERYFSDIADILRKEFTLKNPLSAAAQCWKEKILVAECSVSLHVRHGDFVYHPQNIGTDIFAILPPNYYHECINRLKREHKNLKLFVFSNDIQWCKKYLQPDVPTEYVVGGGLQDVEELYLMSLCKHNVIANSTFSWWAAWLNQNPDKKIFVPIPSSIVGTTKTYRHFSAERNENSPLDSDKWIRVPFDVDNQPLHTLRPYFSLLLVVNDDAATLGETLISILAQDYNFFELIIVDNASTDGSSKICRQAIQSRDNVTLIKLYDKISTGAAYNKALDLAQGNYVLFLKSNDRLLSNALSSMYLSTENSPPDIVNSIVWLREDERGNIDMAGRKFAMEVDSAFRDLQGGVRGKFDKPTLLKILATNEAATPLAAKVFKRKFLADKGVRFSESSGDTNEQLFIIDSILQAEEMIFTPNIFYIAPRK